MVRHAKSELVEGAKTDGFIKLEVARPGKPTSVYHNCQTRNQFGVTDVPNPNDQEVLEFAADAKLAGTLDDENAIAWVAPKRPQSIRHDQRKLVQPVEWRCGPQRFAEMPRTNGNRVKPT